MDCYLRKLIGVRQTEREAEVREESKGVGV
jgi:hypothetical protein